MHIIGSQADTRFYTKGVPMVNNSLFISQYGIGVSKFRPFYIKKGEEGKYLKRGTTEGVPPAYIHLI
jgi:hypothetical protein